MSAEPLRAFGTRVKSAAPIADRPIDLVHLSRQTLVMVSAVMAQADTVRALLLHREPEHP